MKLIFLTLTLLLGFGVYTKGQSTAQQFSSPTDDEKIISEKVNQFFQALEKQDSTLFNSLFFADAQIWATRKNADTTLIRTRSFLTDSKGFQSSRIIYERALHYKINIHIDIATAWVPYELSINQTFSHCGIDVFTFYKTKQGWRIVNVAYSVEPNGCVEIKKKYPNK